MSGPALEQRFAAELRRAGAGSSGPFGRVRFFARRYPLGLAGGVIMAVIVLCTVFAGEIAGWSPLDTNARLALAHPSTAHIFGADAMGRDLFARIVYGARVSLAVGLGSTGLGCLLGVAIGLLSGYAGGWTDLLVQRVMDVLQALPLLVLALVMSAALGPSLGNTIIAISIPLVPAVARVIRSNTLALRELAYIESAQSIGLPDWRIALRHVLPNTVAPVIVLATAQLGSAILTEAALSFLGLGVPEPYPSWGRMLSESAAEYLRTAPWLVIFPGLAISLTVFGANLLGDALRDILDPRQRG
jgi:peptide/nickel transport system permease protein